MRTYGEILREAATYGSITTAAGTLAAVEGNNRISANAKLRAQAKDLKDAARIEVALETNSPYIENNDPRFVSARIAVIENQEKLGTLYPCNEKIAVSLDPKLATACQTLADRQAQDKLYREKISAAGVHQIEAQMTNEIFNYGMYYGGGGTAVASLLLIGSLVAARWLNSKSPIQFVR